MFNQSRSISHNQSQFHTITPFQSQLSQSHHTFTPLTLTTYLPHPNTCFQPYYSSPIPSSHFPSTECHESSLPWTSVDPMRIPRQLTIYHFITQTTQYQEASIHTSDLTVVESLHLPDYSLPPDASLSLGHRSLVRASKQDLPPLQGNSMVLLSTADPQPTT